jgi:hypothetical protein
MVTEDWLISHSLVTGFITTLVYWFMAFMFNRKHKSWCSFIFMIMFGTIPIYLGFALFVDRADNPQAYIRVQQPQPPSGWWRQDGRYSSVLEQVLGKH